MSALLKDHESQIESLTLIPSDGGKFEVEMDGELIYSKQETNRHTDPPEILRLFRERV